MSRALMAGSGAAALFAASILAIVAFAPIDGIRLHAQGQGHDHSAVAADAWARGDAFARALSAAMNRMHRDMAAPAPTGNADRDFLATMIPHHEGAVEMARLVLIHGRDPLVRRLAEEIIASQQAEIAAMRARLDILRRGDDPSPGGYPSLGGTRGSEP